MCGLRVAGPGVRTLLVTRWGRHREGRPAGLLPATQTGSRSSELARLWAATLTGRPPRSHHTRGLWHTVLLTTHHSPHTTHHTPLTTHHSPHTTHHSPHTTPHTPLSTPHSPHISHRTRGLCHTATHHSPHTTHHTSLTTHHSPH